ncbi:putative beta-ig-h3 fasciclin protein [Phaeoacremonium minimum UCRPA7]|uniref:Putative beta-ig-h3 fasciclin protein n=1 Tax=Phaeoacremonium minimum (strain UCR-PA7) TaxID=1286976 RepID=R8BKN6_PHAM7|nr:putative beta-ig-h3 fasciclin protein [Phaeoacremonium minimum UCRPA7]EON99880.1 putative beta-ig-h3 fasciclin protein [Phaeoacremonium minimum UCRPA7]
MRLDRLFASALCLSQIAHCQIGADLGTTIAKYPELSQFGKVLNDNPSLTSVFPANTTHGITLLVPNNDAFEKLYNETGVSIEGIGNKRLVSILKYHIMMANLTSQNFTDSRGLTVPTLLREEQYNNRTAGPALVDKYGKDPAQGQVVYISKDPINPAKLRVRQNTSNVSLRGGLGSVASIEPVNAQWSLGYIQITDTSALYPVLDHTPNVTCLAPSTGAFQDAGSPDQNLNQTELKNALLFHTLHEVAYTDYLVDGTRLESAAGLDVLVTIKGNDIYFNDAKVISPNVL